MSVRELVVLGTASQVPTRRRSHNSCLLRWDGSGILLDPGEGTQRQMTLAGIPASSVTRICITHLHGDHCLGLPGVLQRLALDGVDHPVHLHFPRSGGTHIERLRRAVVYHDTVDLRLHPDVEGTVAETPALTLHARALEHRIDTLGWRLEEPDGRTMLPDRLDAVGITGPDIGRLEEEGTLRVDGRRVTVEEVSVRREGQVFAFVMDTAVCDAAVELAAGADLLVCESTFLSEHADLARRHGHLTAAQAAGIAAEAGASRLVLTHFSQRYDDPEAFRRQAEEVFPDVIVAEDLDRVPLPPRRRAVG